MRALLVIAVTLGLGLALPAAAQNAPREWPGVYKQKHLIEFSDEPAGRYVEDVLEIVQINTLQVYVRLETHAHNGDRCKFSGVAELQGDRVVYRGAPEHFRAWKLNPTPPPTYTASEDEVARCELALSVDKAGSNVVLADVGGYCQRRGLCGVTARFDDWNFPTGSRRDIRYMKRLKASPEYTAALEEAGLSPER